MVFSDRISVIQLRGGFMKLAIFAISTCTVLAFARAVTHLPAAPQSTSVTKTTPLILEKDEGERRVFRSESFPAHFVLKVDPRNAGSSHLVLNTEELPAGLTIPTHRHPSADEIIFLQTGTARIHLGDAVKDAHAGAIVFIPSNTWISVSNIGNAPISLVGVFSEPGFEELMRAASVKEGERIVPLTQAEADEMVNKHSHDAIYASDSSPAPVSPAGDARNETPLILEKNEGERRVMRGYPGHSGPGRTFILKVDPKNGGAQHLVLMTADGQPGQGINAHKHPESDEILFFLNGTGRVHLGDAVRIVHAGATVFIPANTWISVDNIGGDVMSTIAIFSAPGFEQFLRAVSVREGEKNVPMSKAENDAIERNFAHAVMFKEP
jgi:quercetin dioxygenase-like cupin family protein